MSSPNTRGTTIAEALIFLFLASVILALGLSILSFAHRAEDMGGLRSDATSQAALAHASLETDLAALAYGPPDFPLEVTAGPASEWGHLTLHRWDTQDSTARRKIEYIFDAASGILRRASPGQADRRYALGQGSAVRFAIRTPVSEGGRPPPRGAYRNTLSYRISTKARNPRGQRAFTLVGTVPLLKKSSWDTFVFWNLPCYATEPGRTPLERVAD